MCIHDNDELLPYKPGTTEDPAIGRFKRQIAILEEELRLYRELCPGYEYSSRHHMLFSSGFLPDDD